MASTLVHIGVRASDIDKTIRFWRDALGLEVVNELHHGFDLSDGYHNFRVFQHEGPDRPAHVSGMLDYLHIGVKVADLAEAATRLDDMGYEIFWEGVSAGHEYAYDPSKPPSGSFKVEDPDGIVVDVTASDDQWPGVEL